MTYKLAPSLLAADFAALGQAIDTVAASGARYIHFDVMDGHFVPNLSFGLPVLEGIRSRTCLPFDVHLMVSNPLAMVPLFARAGADIITVHAEAVTDMDACLNQIAALGKKAAVAISPATPATVLYPWLPRLDMVLVMSVEPGYGGQTLLPETLRKAEVLADYAARRQLTLDIEMDGGITADNLRRVLDAGVNVVVAGSAVFAPSPEETAANTRAFAAVLAEYEQRGCRSGA